MQVLHTCFLSLFCIVSLAKLRVTSVIFKTSNFTLRWMLFFVSDNCSFFSNVTWISLKCRDGTRVCTHVTSALVGVHTPWQENPLLHPWIVRGFDGVLFAGHSQQFCWSPPSKFFAITLFGNLMYVFDVSPPDTSSLLDPCANHLHYDCHGKVSYWSTFHYNLTSPPPQPFPRHSRGAFGLRAR